MGLRKAVSKVFSYIKTLFFSGLFTLLPIILTVFILTFTYSFIARWLKPLKEAEPLFLQKFPGSEFVLVTLFILFVGVLLKLFFITPIVHKFEKLIKKIPFIRSIYSSSKALVDFFNVPAKSTKKRTVILIEFPSKGFFNIAFLLEEATDNFQKLIPPEKLLPGKKYYKIFMPNSPNPTSGYFLILPEDEIIFTDMTFDEAIKAVVSCGLITPDSIK